MNKDPGASEVEVYNDKDGDLVHFFEVPHDRTEELVDWIRQVHYFRRIYSRWAHFYYKGYRPVDDIERAGRFFYLRYTQWGGKFEAYSGFATSKVQNEAQSHSNKIDLLREFGERFQEAVLEKYDSPETVFYLDPPYVGKEDYYPIGDVDHEAVLEAIGQLEGRAICSYEDLPENEDGLHEVTRTGEKRFINSGLEGSGKDATERLLLNFDPEVVDDE